MQVTTRGPQTAADWTAQNPVLDQFEIGIEVNPATGAYEKAKIGDGRTAWTSLGYWNPSGSTGSGGALTLATVTVDATLDTKQNLLSAVPASTNRMIFGLTVRNASATLLAAGAVNFGFDAGAGDSASFDLSTLEDPTYYLHEPTWDVPDVVGLPGEVYGLILGTPIAGPATFDVDVFYYDVAI